MYTLDGIDCHVIHNGAVSGLSLGEYLVEDENGWAEPVVGLDFCEVRLEGSLLTGSRSWVGPLVRDNGFCLLPAIGNDSPRNLPRLATPTPHVKVVL